jgi:hypothetical protein
MSPGFLSHPPSGFSGRYDAVPSLLGRPAHDTVAPSDLAALPLSRLAVWDAWRLSRGPAKRTPAG